MPAKRAGDDIEGIGSSRKRVASAPTSRTGQACNRCKLRKIKCDARPGGCSPCLQNNTECTTTDRITGRAVSRGHTESIESENATLRLYTEELQQQLRDHGVEPKQEPVHDYLPTTALWGEDARQQASWGDLSSGGGVGSSSGSRELRPAQPSVLPDFRPGCIGDNYLGVSINSGGLSPIAGTRLSLFGITIDLAEFIPQGDAASDPTSYEAFFNTSLGKNAPISKPPLPPLEYCKQYADGFFRYIQVFTPILHRPDFMALLDRLYSGQYEPTVPETVMVHMMIAIFTLQAALRNTTQANLRTESMAHFHYAISFVPDLLIGHQLAHVQALALICLQLRQQPRVGAAWSFSNTVITLAIELGLHRSAKSWQASTSERDPHIVEMRKRVFWSLLVINVTVGGKLGRPMPLRIQDFDIEMPDHVSDSMPGDPSLSTWQQCSFRTALPGMKLLKILMQVYATVYSIRADATPYELSVRRLEKELETFRKELPPEISGGPQTSQEDQCPAYYLKMAEEEIRLVLHHPSIHAGTPDAMSKNLDICLDASKNLLAVATKLRTMYALDTTWYYSTDYLAAIFTTIFVWTQRREQMTSTEFQQLKADMDSWLEVMGDVGALLGTGLRLRECLRNNIIEPRIAIISHCLAAKTTPTALRPAESPISPTNGLRPLQPSQPQQYPQPQQIYTPTNGYPSQYQERAQSHDLSNSAPPGYAVPMQHQHQLPHQQSPYPPPPPGYYSEPTSATIPQYPNLNPFDATPYQDADVKHALTNGLPMGPQPLAPQLPPQHQQSPSHSHHLQQHPPPPPPPPPPGYMGAFPHASPVQQQQNGYHSHTLPPQHPQQHPQPVPEQHPQMIYSGQTAWRDFTNDMMSDLSGGGDYMSSASALMALGDSKAPMGLGMGMGVDGGGADGGQEAWPTIQYGGGGQ